MDPLGGSYFLESLTNQMEEAACQYFRTVGDMGGVIPALKTGYFQREIAESAYTAQLEEDRQERITVGVNQYNSDEVLEIPLLRVDVEGEQRHIRRLNDIRRTRDGRAVASSLRALEQAARGSENLMPRCWRR